MRTISLLLLASLHGACIDPDSGPLSLDVETSDRVAGSYLHGDLVVDFDIARSPSGHTTRFSYENGSPIVDVLVESSRQRLSVFGGKLVVEGELGTTAPAVHGDLFTMRELEAHEVYGIQQVYVHLEDAGVEPALLAPPAPPPSAPRLLAHADSFYWWSTFGPGPRTFEVVNAAPTCTAVAFDSSPGGREVVIARGTEALTRYGWSGLIFVENLGEWTAWSEPVCAPAPVTVRVSP